MEKSCQSVRLSGQTRDLSLKLLNGFRRNVVFGTGLGILKAMKVSVTLFWVMAPCSEVIGYQRFGKPCCFHGVVTQDTMTEIWY